MKKGFNILIILSIFLACQTKPNYQKLRGKTMGTVYNVTCSNCDDSIHSAIDSLLIDINNEMSTYIPNSFISTFNNSSEGLSSIWDGSVAKGFIEVLNVSKEVYDSSTGAFDPTIMPLVNYWGFGYTNKVAINEIDSTRVDSLLQFVGLSKVIYNENNQFLSKSIAGLSLDFSAIAKGYAVDAIAKLLDNENIDNYLIEIGGECKSKGINDKQKIWTLAINNPVEGANLSDAAAFLSLSNKSLATSGNYRNFYERSDGSKYGHTINPKSGYPALNNMLSASVIADECVRADAWATAFMSMGYEKARDKIKYLDDIECLFIYTDGTEIISWTSPGFKTNLIEL